MGEAVQKFIQKRRATLAAIGFGVLLIVLVSIALAVSSFLVVGLNGQLEAAQSGGLEPAAQLASIVMSIVISLSALIAIWTIVSANRRARRASSFEHIARQTRDRELIEMFEEFRQVRNALTKRFDKLNGAPFGVKHVDGQEVSYHKTMLSADDVLKKVFNYYEATAIGIDTDALDNDHIKRWWRGTYVLDFRDFAAFVYEQRLLAPAPELYVEYEKVARRWAKPEELKMIDLAKDEAERSHGHSRR